MQANHFGVNKEKENSHHTAVSTLFQLHSLPPSHAFTLLVVVPGLGLYAFDMYCQIHPRLLGYNISLITLVEMYINME